MKKGKKKLVIIAVIAGILLFSAIAFIIIRRMNSVSLNLEENITVTSDAFQNGGKIPVKYTGEGEDISPDLKLSSVSPNAKSIAVIMDDLDTPFGVYNHWVVWNIPVMNQIPEGIPHGAVVNSLNGAIQGVGYGKNRYRGPKPPFNSSHRYKYQVYVLDTVLNLNSNATKKDLIKQMQGHVLQYGSITGKFH